MKIKIIISMLMLITINAFGYDFIYEPNLLTRSSDPFYIKERIMRFDDRTIKLDQETQLYYREYNGKKYYCTDGTITETEEEATLRGQREEQRYMENIQKIAKQAAIFRWVLRQHFGEGAETNQTITEDYVTEYFVMRRIMGNSGANDASDAILLQNGFNVIKAITGDGTSWSLRWDLIPEL